MLFLIEPTDSTILGNIYIKEICMSKTHEIYPCILRLTSFSVQLRVKKNHGLQRTKRVRLPVNKTKVCWIVREWRKFKRQVRNAHHTDHSLGAQWLSPPHIILNRAQSWKAWQAGHKLRSSPVNKQKYHLRKNVLEKGFNYSEIFRVR